MHYSHTPSSASRPTPIHLASARPLGSDGPTPPEERTKRWLHIFARSTDIPTDPPSGGGGDGGDGDGEEPEGESGLEQFLTSVQHSLDLAARIPDRELTPQQLRDVAVLVGVMATYRGLLGNI